MPSLTHNYPARTTIKRVVFLGIAASALATGVIAQVRTTYTTMNMVGLGFKTEKLGPKLYTIRSEGQIIAELRVFKPSRLETKGVVEFVRVDPSNPSLLIRDPDSTILILPEGLPNWPISGTNIEVEASALILDKK